MASLTTEPSKPFQGMLSIRKKSQEGVTLKKSDGLVE
jgi:hypothetical protein